MRSAQARAITHVAAQTGNGPAAGEPVDASLRVTVHFHPDRLVGGLPILGVMASGKVYRSQFETGTSNGGLTAHPGGDRWLAQDVEALVVDPGYRGTSVEKAAGQLGCPVEWHGGFTPTTTELCRHPHYRGPGFVDPGLSLARDGRLDPGIIGDASRTGRYDEQALKRVWHYVARFGTPEFGN